MCNRYRLKDPKAAFDWMEVEPAFPFVPRLNIAPTQRVAVVTGRHGIEEMTWGIVPRWAKEVEKGPKALFNARSETVREKRTFKSAIGNGDAWCRRMVFMNGRGSGGDRTFLPCAEAGRSRWEGYGNRARKGTGAAC